MASTTQPHGKLLDYEQYIDHQLGRTRAKIKMTDILTASLMLVAATLGVLLLEVVLDHAVGLPVWLRRIVLVSGLAGAAAFSAVRIVLPLIRRVNGLYAAKTIEEADPAFQNSLINYIELRRRRGELPKSFLAAIEAKAVNDLTQVEIDAVVNQRRLIHVWYALAAVVLLFCGYAALTPKSISDSARRALLADVVRPTNTRLRNIKPGDDPELSRVVAGAHVPFTVDVEGTSPPRVILHYSVDGGKFFAIQELAPGKDQYDPWQTTLRNVQESIEYYLTGGDAESLRYHLEVSPAPMVTSVSLDYRFPDYLGLPPRTDIGGGNVEAIEGTVVTVHARTNEPARSASLVFTKAKPEPMEVASDDPRTLVGRFKVEESGTYTIKFQTTGGQANPEPVVYDILALSDKAPTAQFLRPDQAKVKVPSNVPVALVMRANDDHGVKDVTLHVHEVKARDFKEEAVSLVSENLLEKKPPVREFHGTKTLDLAALRVKPGARLEYWLTVRDTKQPESNRGESPHQYLDVADPVPPKEQKKFEDAARKEKEQEVPPPEAAQAENPEQAPPPQEAPAKPGREPQPPQDRGGAEQQRNAGREDEKTEPRASDRGANEREGDNQAQRQPPTNPDDLRKLDKLREALGMKRPQQAPQGGGQRNAQGENAPPPADATGQPGSQTQNDPNSANPSGSVASGNRTAGQQSRANAPSNPSTTPPNGAPNSNTTSPEVARANPNQTPGTQAQPDGQQGQPGARSRANDPRRGAPGARSRANANGQQGQPGAQSQGNVDGQPGQPGEQSQANANPDGKGQTAAPSQANGQRGEPGTQSQTNANGQQGMQTQADANGQNGQPGAPSQANAEGQKNQPGMPSQSDANGQQGSTDMQSQANADGQKGMPSQANANGPQGPPGIQSQTNANGQQGMQTQANANGQKGPPGTQSQANANGQKGEPGTQTQANADRQKAEPGAQSQANANGQQGEPGTRTQADANGQKGEPGAQSHDNGQKGKPGTQSQSNPNGQKGMPSQANPNGQKGEPGAQQQANANGKQSDPGAKSQANVNANGQKGEPGTQTQDHANGQKGMQSRANGQKGQPGAQSQTNADGQKGESGAQTQDNANGQKGMQSRANGQKGQPGAQSQANASGRKGE
ncbi:MAG: hypothetical protein JOZ63_04140, partial [Planctomycetaceae bacterium]|nr:hypothetical protein [Planctomycetaceae bacterium]